MEIIINNKRYYCVEAERTLWLTCKKDFYPLVGTNGPMFVKGKAYPCRNGYVENGEGLSSLYDECRDYFRPWHQQDAHPGDVLTIHDMGALTPTVFIFNKHKGDLLVESSCYVTASGFPQFVGQEFKPMKIKIANQGITPATKEERDLLFEKMHEAGYVWDAEKLELKKYKPVEKKEVTGKLKEMLDNIDPVELEETQKEMMEESASTDDTFFDDYRKTDGEYDEVHISEHDHKSVHLQFTAEGRNISDFLISRIDALILANSIILCLTDSEDTGVLRQFIAALKKQKRKERYSPTSIGHNEGVNTPGKKSPFSEKPITVNVDDNNSEEEDNEK